MAMTDFAHRRRRRATGAEYWLYFGLVFAISLPVALLRRLLPVRPGPVAAPRSGRTILGDARSMAESVVPMLFSA